MRLVKIELQDFRNIEKAELLFEGERHFFLGANGQGKTNMLEAIAIAQTLRSFRTPSREPLIRAGTTQATVRTHWQHEKRGETILGVSFSEAKREAILDGEKIRTLEEVLGVFPVVALTLADRELIYGGPGARRSEIDKLVSQLDHEYYKALKDYTKALKSRNQLLAEGGTKAQFEAFEAILNSCGKVIIEKRDTYLKKLAEKFKEAFHLFAPEGESPEISYAPNTSENLAKALEETRAKDRGGHTSVGPHRDRIELLFNKQPSELYASEGQKFSIVLGLKLGGLNLLREELKIAPVLVADDLLLELDPRRQERVWESIKDLQVFASGTVRPQSGGWRVWEVNEGKFNSL